MVSEDKIDITFSIIIPHYNVASYLDCLYRKLLPQITPAVQLLLIEDCSTDHTKERMQYWEKYNHNTNIQFIYLNKNIGLSGVRNYGLALAQGEYTWFIDSDDIVTPDAISKILHIIQRFAPQAIVFDFYKFEDGTNIYPKMDVNSSLIQSKQRSLLVNTVSTDSEQLLKALFDDAQMYVWCYVIKTNFWKRFPFPEGKKYEDIFVMPKIMYRLEKLFYLQAPLYYYRQREKSIRSAPTIDSCMDLPFAMQHVEVHFRVEPISETTRISLYTFYLKVLRLSYDNLYQYHLLTDQSLKLYKVHEKYFLKILPWNKYNFIAKMHIYPIFKITSLLFFTNKTLYMTIKKIFGRS